MGRVIGRRTLTLAGNTKLCTQARGQAMYDEFSSMAPMRTAEAAAALAAANEAEETARAAKAVAEAAETAAEAAAAAEAEAVAGTGALERAMVEQLVLRRSELRGAGEFDQADGIAQRLVRAGVVLCDEGGDTSWSYGASV